MSKRAFVTGANGFIGKHLVARLVTEGWHVTVYDHKPATQDAQWHVYIQGDIFENDQLASAMRHADPSVVFHLAALADVRNALKQPNDQMRMNFEATGRVLEAMRAVGVKQIAFTSSAVVYGDTPGCYSPIRESSRIFPQQTSIYGAMKLASESLISAYCHGYGMRADIYRLVSLVGEGYRHGNLMDFYRKLQADPTKLTILGTGQQEKYYIYVGDVVDAMIRTTQREHDGAEIWNVSHDQPNTINDSVQAVCDALDLHPQIVHEGDPWAGDLPGLVLDCSKLRALGWEPKTSIRDGMRKTVHDFLERGL